MKFLKNKFFIIMLCIALALVIVPSVLSLMGLGSYVTDAVMTLTSPFRSAATYVADAVEGFTSYFTEYDRLKAENAELKERIAELEEEYYDIEEIEELNEWLMDYLELAREHTDYDLEVANIVGRETGNYMTVFTLDAGTESGIDVDMPVITSDGIVGYVTEVGTNWCKVLTILESSSSVGAVVEATGDLGLLEGDFEMREEGLCKLTYLSADSEVAVGDRIISSGLGSIYPRGLVIGYVESIEYDEYSRTITAYVSPSADLENLSRVMIIKSYETVAE